MKVLVTSQGNTVESLVDDRFGRAAFFAIFDGEAKDHKIIDNPGFKSDHGAGVVASQTVSSEKVDVVITGHLGPNAVNSLKAAEIIAYRLPGKVTVQAAYDAFLADELEPLLAKS